MHSFELVELLHLRHVSVTRIGESQTRMKTNLASSEVTYRRAQLPCPPVAVLPDDLPTLVPEQMLVKLALEAVQTVEWPDPAPEHASASDPTLPRPLMMTVLIYCYAAGMLGSRDIESRVHHDQPLRYLCRSAVPGWNTLRIFRRHHVRLVTRCLETLLELVWEWTKSNGCRVGTIDPDYQKSSCIQVEPLSSEPDFAREAEQRVARAIHADSMAMDD